MIKINNLSKKYNNKLALDKLTASFSEGDFCALVGANGAGKSTLLRILSNLEHPNDGHCLIDGIDITTDQPGIKEKIAYIDENINFQYNDSVEFFLEQYKKFYTSWDSTLLEYLFKNQFIDKSVKFTELSRGQKMQLVLAASLARHPKYILIDEVTALMDSYIRTFFMDYLKEYAQKHSAIVILATNIVTEVDYIANKLLILNFGKASVFDEYKNIKEEFIKIRSPAGSNNPLFNNDNCVWTQRNRDGTSSFIIKKDDLKKSSLEGTLEDKREVLISEIYCYFNSIARGKNVEKAA